MKKILTILLATLALQIHARDITLAWDLNPPEQGVEGYNLYGVEITPEGETNYTRIGSALMPPLILKNVSFAPHAYVLTATNAWGESGYSNTATVEGVAPTQPGLEIETDTGNNTVSIGFEFPSGQFYVETAPAPLGPWSRFVYVAPMGDWQPDKIIFDSTRIDQSQFWKMTPEAVP